jgi:hypothetical protein
VYLLLLAERCMLIHVGKQEFANHFYSQALICLIG